MTPTVNPLRLLTVLVVCLLVLGVVALIVTGHTRHAGAAARGYLGARIDLHSGRRELQISSVRLGRPLKWARRISELGLPTTEEYYNCLTGSACAAYHRSYDAEVRRSIRREFGYDVFAELTAKPLIGAYIVIQHR